MLGNPSILLTNMNIQVQATEAINDMYNFKFDRADMKFSWMRQDHPDHPLPYFLLGLSQWWRIVPNIQVERYDDAFLSYMDQSIEKAERSLDRDPDNVEANFFLAAAWGFKGRLYSERKQWRKATFAGKNALNYMQKSKDKAELSPEFLFGDGLYNYYAEWIPENYFWLRPIVALFPKGDKELGLKQLREVTLNAFYTRTEAQFFLMQIYASEEGRPDLAMPIADRLHTAYPDNAYFERYYARLCFTQGRLREAEETSASILDKIEAQMPGYEAVSGRYAAFYLGYINQVRHNDLDKAKGYFKQAVQFAEASGQDESGYYLHSLAHLARIADAQGNVGQARDYYQLIKKKADRKHSTYDEARNYLRSHRKA